MVRFGSTSRAVKLLTLFLSMLLMLSGCSLDILRPDLFNDADMQIFPNWMDGDSDNSEEGDSRVQQGSQVAVWPNGSPYNSNYSYTRPSNTDVTDNFAGMPRETVQCMDYGNYLQTEVFEKLTAIIQRLPQETQDKLYLRCGHTGYNVNGKEIRRGNGYADYLSGDEIRTSRMVGGDILMMFATDWVGSLPGNADHVTLQIQRAQDAILQAAKDDDWEQSWAGLGSSAIPQAYLNMMNRDGANFKTLQEYYDAIATDPYHNIPNFSLQMRAGETSTETMTFNPVSVSAVDTFHTGVSLDTVDKCFRVQNQYSTRDRDPVDETRQGDSCIVRYYIDGYNKTLIFLGCVDGENLVDLVEQDVYEEIYNVIHDAANCTEVSKVKSVVPVTEYDEITMMPYQVGPDYSGVVTIPAGTKGVD